MKNHDNSDLEEMLRDALGRQAERGSAPGISPGLDRVLGRARTIRRHRRQGMAAIAAAAIVAVTVPTTIYLHGQTDASEPVGPAHPGTPTIGVPSPDPSPSAKPSSSPTPSAPSAPSSPVSTGYPTLSAIPRGAGTTVTYLDLSGRVHDNGTVTKLPGNTDGLGTSFHDFRGGWVVYDDNSVAVTQYDSAGRVLHTGKGSGRIAVSADRTEIAWQIGSRLYYGPTNTMGNGGPATTTAPLNAGLVGFLPSGPAFATGNTIATMTSSGGYQSRNIGMLATTTSQSADLVGGVTGTVAQGNYRGTVYDLTAHRTLWANSWQPMAFSDDGRYVAVRPVADNGDPSTFAILDARTGRLIAHLPKLGSGIYLDGWVAWDGDSIVVEASGAKATQSALLSLSPTGAFSRVSDVVTGPTGSAAFRFAAQP